MLRFTIATATVMVAVVLIYGALQADDVLGDRATQVATSTIDGWLPGTTTLDAWPTPTPQAIVALPGSTFVVQVRGGDNPCRYLYQGSVGTFAGGDIVVEFVAGTHDANLADTGEMDLYGDTGPHLFEIEDPGDAVILSVPVARGATVHADVVFRDVGLYGIYDRARPDLGRVGEIFARPIGSPGYYPVTGWCPPGDGSDPG